MIWKNLEIQNYCFKELSKTLKKIRKKDKA